MYESNFSEGERAFFDLVGQRVERFARRHRLRLEKWFKDVALWGLAFRHPLGGTASIVLGPQGELPRDGAELDSSWWVDDYDSETRRLAWRHRRGISVDEPLLEEALMDEIRHVLAWTEADLEDHKMPEGTWHRWFSKEAFERLDRSLRRPRL